MRILLLFYSVLSDVKDEYDCKFWNDEKGGPDRFCPANSLFRTTESGADAECELELNLATEANCENGQCKGDFKDGAKVEYQASSDLEFFDQTPKYFLAGGNDFFYYEAKFKNVHRGQSEIEESLEANAIENFLTTNGQGRGATVFSIGDPDKPLNISIDQANPTGIVGDLITYTVDAADGRPKLGTGVTASPEYTKIVWHKEVEGYGGSNSVGKSVTISDVEVEDYVFVGRCVSILRDSYPSTGAPTVTGNIRLSGLGAKPDVVIPTAATIGDANSDLFVENGGRQLNASPQYYFKNASNAVQGLSLLESSFGPNSATGTLPHFNCNLNDLFSNMDSWDFAVGQSLLGAKLDANFEVYQVSGVTTLNENDKVLTIKRGVFDTRILAKQNDTPAIALRRGSFTNILATTALDHYPTDPAAFVETDEAVTSYPNSLDGDRQISLSGADKTFYTRVIPVDVIFELRNVPAENAAVEGSLQKVFFDQNEAGVSTAGEGTAPTSFNMPATKVIRGGRGTYAIGFFPRIASTEKSSFLDYDADGTGNDNPRGGTRLSRLIGYGDDDMFTHLGLFELFRYGTTRSEVSGKDLFQLLGCQRFNVKGPTNPNANTNWQTVGANRNGMIDVSKWIYDNAASDGENSPFFFSPAAPADQGGNIYASDGFNCARQNLGNRDTTLNETSNLLGEGLAANEIDNFFSFITFFGRRVGLEYEGDDSNLVTAIDFFSRSDLASDTEWDFFDGQNYLEDPGDNSSPRNTRLIKEISFRGTPEGADRDQSLNSYAIVPLTVVQSGLVRQGNFDSLGSNLTAKVVGLGGNLNEPVAFTGEGSLNFTLPDTDSTYPATLSVNVEVQSVSDSPVSLTINTARQGDTAAVSISGYTITGATGGDPAAGEVLEVTQDKFETALSSEYPGIAFEKPGEVYKIEVPRRRTSEWTVGDIFMVLKSGSSFTLLSVDATDGKVYPIAVPIPEGKPQLRSLKCKKGQECCVGGGLTCTDITCAAGFKRKEMGQGCPLFEVPNGSVQIYAHRWASQTSDVDLNYGLFATSGAVQVGQLLASPAGGAQYAVVRVTPWNDCFERSSTFDSRVLACASSSNTNEEQNFVGFDFIDLRKLTSSASQDLEGKASDISNTQGGSLDDYLGRWGFNTISAPVVTPAGIASSCKTALDDTSGVARTTLQICQGDSQIYDFGTWQRVACESDENSCCEPVQRTCEYVKCIGSSPFADPGAQCQGVAETTPTSGPRLIVSADDENNTFHFEGDDSAQGLATGEEVVQFRVLNLGFEDLANGLDAEANELYRFAFYSKDAVSAQKAFAFRLTRFDSKQTKVRVFSDWTQYNDSQYNLFEQFSIVKIECENSAVCCKSEERVLCSDLKKPFGSALKPGATSCIKASDGECVNPDECFTEPQCLYDGMFRIELDGVNITLPAEWRDETCTLLKNALEASKETGGINAVEVQCSTDADHTHSSSRALQLQEAKCMCSWKSSVDNALSFAQQQQTFAAPGFKEALAKSTSNGSSELGDALASNPANVNNIVIEPESQKAECCSTAGVSYVRKQFFELNTSVILTCAKEDTLTLEATCSNGSSDLVLNANQEDCPPSDETPGPDPPTTTKSPTPTTTKTGPPTPTGPPAPKKSCAQPSQGNNQVVRYQCPSDKVAHNGQCNVSCAQEGKCAENGCAPNAAKVTCNDGILLPVVQCNPNAGVTTQPPSPDPISTTKKPDISTTSKETTSPTTKTAPPTPTTTRSSTTTKTTGEGKKCDRPKSWDGVVAADICKSVFHNAYCSITCADSNKVPQTKQILCVNGEFKVKPNCVAKTTTPDVSGRGARAVSAFLLLAFL